MVVTGESAHDASGSVIPRQVYVDPLGWCWIRPLEYGDIISYNQRPGGTATLSWLFNRSLCGFETEPADIDQMRLNTPRRLEYAILKASDVVGNDVPEPATEPTPDFREDSPFATDAGPPTEDSVEHSVYWLHDQGYTFSELYTLLIGEIETLSEGFKEEQQRRDNTTDSGSETTSTAHGNRGDRAAQLGWRG